MCNCLLHNLLMPYFIQIYDHPLVHNTSGYYVAICNLYTMFCLVYLAHVLVTLSLYVQLLKLFIVFNRPHTHSVFSLQPTGPRYL